MSNHNQNRYLCGDFLEAMKFMMEEGRKMSARHAEHRAKHNTLAAWNRRQAEIIARRKGDTNIDHDRQYERDTQEKYER